MANKKESIKKDIEVTGTLKKDEIVENPLRKTMSDKTRYLIVGITTVIFLIILVVVIVINNDNSTSGATPTGNIEERNTSTALLKEFYKNFDSKEINVIFFESSECSYCQLQAPIIKQIAEDYDFTYYDIDASKLSEEEATEIINVLGLSGGTPSTVVVKEGKVLDINEGYVDGKPFVQFLVNAGVLKKGSTYKPEDNINEISYDKFKSIADKDDYQLIYLDTTACPECIEVRSILGKLAQKNDFEINYLSAWSLSEDDVNKLIEEDFKEMEYDDKDYIDNSTIKIPLLLVVKNNKIRDYILESTEESDYIKLLEKYDFID